MTDSLVWRYSTLGVLFLSVVLDTLELSCIWVTLLGIFADMAMGSLLPKGEFL